MTTESRFATLTYHVIGEENNRPYTVSEKQLRAHLELLKADAYAVDGFEQLEARLRSGGHLPSRYIVLTFDDGHESSMRAADLLETYGCQATFFLTRDRSLNKAAFIREPEIRELRKRGFSLGTHGTTHRPLTFVPEQDCIEELKGSKQWLEDVIGEEIRYTSPPGGFVNARVMKLIYEHGYALAGTCNEWMNSIESMTLPGTVNRVNIRQQFSTQDFRHVIKGFPGFYIWRQVRAAALAIPKQLLCG